MLEQTPSLLFVCVEKSNRSQMGEGLISDRLVKAAVPSGSDGESRS